MRRSESQLEDVRAFLNMLVSLEAVYKVKVDCIQKHSATPMHTEVTEPN